MLGGLFNREQDPLHKQAETLVPAARINATVMFVPLLGRGGHPVISDGQLAGSSSGITIQDKRSEVRLYQYSARLRSIQPLVKTGAGREGHY